MVVCCVPRLLEAQPLNGQQAETHFQTFGAFESEGRGNLETSKENSSYIQELPDGHNERHGGEARAPLETYSKPRWRTPNVERCLD